MSSGLSSSIDLVEVLFTLFWVFFAGLIFYLHRESKREGYPLVTDRRGDRVSVEGFPGIPPAKTFNLIHGGTRTAPRDEAPQVDVALSAAAPFPGAPFVPTGDPMRDGVGPASFANRADTPDLTLEGANRVVPLRVAPETSVDPRDGELAGRPLIAADGKQVGTIRDAWFDRSEPQIYYLEASLSAEFGGRDVLVPIGFVDIRRGRENIRVDAIHSHQFQHVPGLSSPDQVTLLEEDKISAYYAGGLLYADAARQEPWI